MKIAGTGSWYGFTQTATGDGAIAITGKVVRTSTALNAGVAQLEKKLHVQPNEVIAMRVLARLVSGSRSRIAISHPTAQAPKNTEYITSRNWQHYEVKFAVPSTHNVVANNPDFLNLILGAYYEDDGVAEFTDVEVDSSAFGLPAPRMVALGKIKIANGVPSIDTNAVSHGIAGWGAASNPAGGLIVLQMDWSNKTNMGFAPLPFVTHDGNLNRQVAVSASMDNSGLGRVNLVFSRPDTGAVIDMTTINSLSFNLMVIA